MILDRTGLLSENQVITATTASTNVIDIGPFGTPYGAGSPLRRDLGRGTDIPIVVQATESFNNLTGFQISVQTSADAAFTSPTTVFTSPTYTLAQMAVNGAHLLPDTLPVNTAQRYFRLLYTVTGTAPSTGRITAGITLARQTNRGVY
jgi:hypothetical protein